ncbi:Sialoadhesin Sialic acid-binding [Triplophysa tibetana]|uniref:Sialoadhesin Sialic acid-binding n=1 Tax=Triplophysa tibetana TaxID=1572043 RepID=A0A5A9PJL3_9TELE|nr:Sialoadhesin Sialic acid-binding [Triplophysa tibetana]
MATCFTISLMFLLMTADVEGQQVWRVDYNPSYVCALRGSTVRMSCIYPPDYWITPSYWTKTTHQPYSVSPNLCSDTYYREKVQCHTNRIILTHVTEADKGVYYCIFTNGYSREWRGTPGVQLDVTDLQVETQQRVKEGDSVTLTCKTTCRLTEETTFIWYRNTQTLTEHTVNEFHLQSVSRHDSGLYRCAIRGHEHLSSPDVNLDVECECTEGCVSAISSSGVIVEGDSVNLTCSSASNPPVHIYSWFKENQTPSVGSGQTFSITNINSSLSGWFYCEAQNKHGSQRSAAVSLTVTGVKGSALYTVFGFVAGCGGLFLIIIFIILFIKKRRTDSRAEHMNQKQTADSSDDTYTALNPASRTSADIYNTIRVNLSNIHSQTLLHSNSHENKIYSSCFFHSRISAGLLMASTRLLSFSPDLLNMIQLK